ncbi:MAG TPA: hypothetical protein VM535_00935 [Candidatus Saccharimonadales bacterium]|nr:hypothetical protein [Candidatus Saccharimonadales bacterium]
MNSKRLYYVLLGLIGLLIISLPVAAYGANNLLTVRANKLTALKAKNEALQQEQAGLAAAKSEVKAFTGLQQIAQAVVPEDKDQAQAVRELVKISSDHGVSLSSITFPASSLGSSGPATASSTASAAPKVSASSSAVKLSQLQPVKNIAGVYVLQITVQSDANRPVPYNSFISFLQGLEHNRRTAQISAITIQPSLANPNLLTFTLTLNEYIKP